MTEINLNKSWTVEIDGFGKYTADVPCSMYSVLVENKAIDDPYYRNNEDYCFPLSEKDCVFTNTFVADDDLLKSDKVVLKFEGIDTIADIYLNDVKLAYVCNMHRTWEFDVKEYLNKSENILKLYFHSPNKYIADKQKKIYLGGLPEGTEGYPHLRKAHYMFGWDWGPRLPDMGIWRSVKLLGINTARFSDIHIRQEHTEGNVKLNFNVENEKLREANLEYEVTITTPGNEEITIQNSPKEYVIDNPLLWWPNGYGEQHLYTVKFTLKDNDNILDTQSFKIGLRTMTVTRENKGDFETFCHCINGVDIFAMGANYIPEDNIIAQSNYERTKQLLKDAVLANYNCVRVWGGGYYPEDYFYDLCDELGLIVWQDFMFACANYELYDEFEEMMIPEFEDNVKRLRHHASLGLWCGNNEMEGFYANGGMWRDVTMKQKSDYLTLFEYIIPKVVKKYDPDTFYWPSSPSSGGSFDDPGSSSRGDVHYWDVWHGNKPFTEYRKFMFTYVSEFGFQAFPSSKTVESFTEKDDRNIFSYVMEKHQRNCAANGKILNYMQQMYLYPTDFDTLLYTSQLLSAESIKYGVEHWRRNRGRCMGSIVWQLNDCWPVASWSSIDYFNRWKALHYFEKRFYAPIMISCCEEGMISQNPDPNAEPYNMKKSIRLNVANETLNEIKVDVKWQLRNNKSDVLQDGGVETITVPPLSSYWLDEVNLPVADPFTDYVYYACEKDGKIISEGTVIFSMPKYFKYINPNITAEICGDEIVVKSDAYARCVELLNENEDWILEDNYFDMNKGEKRIKILRGSGKEIKARSVYNIR